MSLELNLCCFWNAFIWKNYNLTFTFQMEGTCILELFVVSNVLWSDKMKKSTYNKISFKSFRYFIFWTIYWELEAIARTVSKQLTVHAKDKNETCGICLFFVILKINTIFSFFLLLFIDNLFYNLIAQYIFVNNMCKLFFH